MVLSYDLITCARRGDLDAVQRFLAGGGDPDDRVGPGEINSGETLLHMVAGSWRESSTWGAPDRDEEHEQRKCSIVSALLAAGATVDAQRDTPKNTPLVLAAIFGRAEMTRLLCEAGADVNYRRSDGAWNNDFPLAFGLKNPDVVRVLLRFGADPSTECETGPGAGHDMVLPEVEALRRANRDGTSILNSPGRKAAYRESASILKDARLLRPRLRGVFALRALCHRGRAAQNSATPGKFAAPEDFFAQRRLRAGAKLLASPGLPDPLAHLVCKFWLGEPPRRRTE